MARIKKTGKCVTDVEKLAPSHTAVGTQNGAAALENSLAVSQKVKLKSYHMTQQFHPWVYTQED